MMGVKWYRIALIYISLIVGLTIFSYLFWGFGFAFYCDVCLFAINSHEPVGYVIFIIICIIKIFLKICHLLIDLHENFYNFIWSSISYLFLNIRSGIDDFGWVTFPGRSWSLHFLKQFLWTLLLVFHIHSVLISHTNRTLEFPLCQLQPRQEWAWQASF